MNHSISKSQQKIYEAIDDLFEVRNANDALHTMLVTGDSEDLTFSNCARNGLGALFGMLGDKAFQVVNKLEDLAEELKREEKKNSLNLANLLQQENGHE